MQLWPATDDFAHGTPAYGQHVIGYLGCVPGSGYQPGRIHNGYGAASAAARSQDQVDTTGNPVGMLRRQTFPAPVRVRLVSRKHAVAGVADVSHLKRHALLARVTNGTLAGDGTDHVRLGSITGYALTVEWVTPDNLLRFRLLRFDAGTAVVLATVDDAAGLAGNFLSDTELTLEVTTNGAGNVELAGYAKNLATGADIATVVYTPGGHGHKQVSTALLPVPGVPMLHHTSQPGTIPAAKLNSAVLLIAATDTSGSKITAGGRCGFAIDPERVVTTPGAASVVSLASLFEVADLTVDGAPAVLWRDEWARAAPTLMQAMTDRFGTAGRNLASDYSCDRASVETTNILKRATADASAESPTTFDDGQATSLDGVDDALELHTPVFTFDAQPVTGQQLEVSIGVWARITENRDGNELYAAIETLTLPADGFAFGWRTGAAGNFKLQARLGGGAGGGGIATLNSPERSDASHLGQAWLYALTYKANANPSTGEGRVRFYVGRLGVATLLGEVAVPANARPNWLLNQRHYLGRRDGFVGAAADTFLKGALDEAHVFYQELSIDEVGLLANHGTDPAAVYPALALAAGWHMDTFVDVAGQKRTAPWYATASAGIPASNNDWLRLVGATILTAGLVPVAPTARFVALGQREADDPVEQHRSVLLRPASDISAGGVVVRGAPGGSPSTWSGYRLDVAPGSPAAIALYRVVAGVATKMAQQDPVTGTVNVSSGAYVAAALQVRQQAGGGPLGPVVLTARVGGVAVPMVSVEPSSVLVNLDGDVVDIHDDRLLSGPLEGFHGQIDGLANRFDDWTLGVLSGPGTADAAPSYPLPEEADGAFGDLADVFVPDWPVERRVTQPRVALDFESGHQLRQATDGYERRRFPVHKAGMTDEELAALVEFFDDHEGGAIPFEWDPSVFVEEEPPGYWRFATPLRDGWEGGKRTVSFELEEVRAPSPS